MDDLLKLAERCEQAAGPDRELDAEIAAAMHVKQLTYQPDKWIKDPEFTASLDTAMTLMVKGNGYQLASEYSDEILPDSITYRLTGRHGCRVYTPNHGSFEATCLTPALALCAAALRARVTEKGG